MSSVQATAASSTAASTTSAANQQLQATQDRFLTLLVTQMRNQDPLNPLDNAEITSQMAQLSTVTGINKLNDSLNALSAMYQSSQALQASSMIGRFVLAPGSYMELMEGASVGGVELEGPADNVVITIKDKSGNVMDTVDLGSKEAGIINFGWDGTKADGSSAADGTYSFSVKAMQNGKDVKVTPLALGSVGSITLGAQGPIVNATGLGALSYSQIKQIL